MRPRSLPPLTDGWQEVLQQQSSNTRIPSEDQWHSRESSQSTTTSSISSPTSTPTLANSASSLLSAASSYDHPPPDSAPISCHKKTWSQLPDVAEEPVERDYQTENISDYADLADSSPSGGRFSQDYYPADHQESFYNFGPEYDGHDVGEHEDNEGHSAKRRRSGDFSFNGLASRMVQRIPSFARRSRSQHKRSATSMSHRRSEEVASPTFGSRPASSAFSSGRTSADGFGGSFDLDRHCLVFIPDLVDDISHEAGELPLRQLEPLEESIEPTGRASTPLLHPLMTDLSNEPPVQSPLQSPTIATHSVGVSVSNTPAGTPHITSQLTPPLSTKPSASSVHRSRASTLIPSSEIPPIVIAENDDPWSDKLGHANFQIYPEPYLPEYCDASSCTQLVKDWNIARTEFSKHLARTELHFGANSRTYRLTEEKWVEIEVNWRASHELALRRAKQNGNSPPPETANAPGSIPKVPVMHDSSHEAKFPHLGDTDIVGLMDQGPPLASASDPSNSDHTLGRRKSRSRRASLIKFISSISLPGAKSLKQ